MWREFFVKNLFFVGEHYYNIILLVYLAIPVAAIYYPLFFIGKAFSKFRLAAILTAALLLAYAVIA